MNERALCFVIGILEQYHVTPPRARGVTGPRQQAPYGTMGATTAEMQSAQAFQRRRGQAERAALLGFILFGSTLKDDQVIMAFKPPFDIIHMIAQEARRTAQSTKIEDTVSLPGCDSNIARRLESGRQSSLQPPKANARQVHAALVS
jgi:hypothetical protein